MHTDPKSLAETDTSTVHLVQNCDSGWESENLSPFFSFLFFFEKCCCRSITSLSLQEFRWNQLFSVVAFESGLPLLQKKKRENVHANQAKLSWPFHCFHYHRTITICLLWNETWNNKRHTALKMCICFVLFNYLCNKKRHNNLSVLLYRVKLT